MPHSIWDGLSTDWGLTLFSNSISQYIMYSPLRAKWNALLIRTALKAIPNIAICKIYFWRTVSLLVNQDFVFCRYRQTLSPLLIGLMLIHCDRNCLNGDSEHKWHPIIQFYMSALHSDNWTTLQSLQSRPFYLYIQTISSDSIDHNTLSSMKILNFKWFRKEKLIDLVWNMT